MAVLHGTRAPLAVNARCGDRFLDVMGIRKRSVIANPCTLTPSRRMMPNTAETHLQDCYGCSRSWSGGLSSFSAPPWPLPSSSRAASGSSSPSCPRCTLWRSSACRSGTKCRATTGRMPRSGSKPCSFWASLKPTRPSPSSRYGIIRTPVSPSGLTGGC